MYAPWGSARAASASFPPGAAPAPLIPSGPKLQGMKGRPRHVLKRGGAVCVWGLVDDARPLLRWPCRGEATVAERQAWKNFAACRARQGSSRARETMQETCLCFSLLRPARSSPSPMICGASRPASSVGGEARSGSGCGRASSAGRCREAASVIPDQFAAFALEQADCSASARIENDDDPQRLGSACGAKEAVVVSGSVARALVWIGAAHRATPNANTPPSTAPYRHCSGAMNLPRLTRAVP
jgi:hypothetical protein